MQVMAELARPLGPIEMLMRRQPLPTYFVLAYMVSWLAALLVVAPTLMAGEAIPQTAGLMMFSAMLLGPSAVGLVLTRMLDGRAGLRELGARLRQLAFPARWYLALLVPPCLILTVLICMERRVSPAFAPGQFFPGLLFGVPAGLFEEIGWTGFAFPRMARELGPLWGSVLLGLLWGVWHFPAIDFLGTATPHGSYKIPYFVAFVAAMTTMRILIAWIYVNTKSIQAAQLMHISSTGSLVAFSPHVGASQEVQWYSVYAVVLWIVAIAVVMIFGRRLTIASWATSRLRI
jgi:membrane protease YdiL (CAAX protease family)